MNSQLRQVNSMLRSKPLWAVVAASSLALAIWLGVARHAGIWPIIVFGIMPDIALFAGTGSGLAKGQLHPRAVRLYNALHSLWGPIALALATVGFGWSHVWLVGAIAWTMHIAVDRAVGYGFRDKNGFQRG